VARHVRARQAVGGQTVLLQGTGGVSVFALQLARAMGIQAIITSSSDDKLARARTLGANHGINYKTTPDWEKAAMEFIGGRGVDQVVEVGGAGTLAKSFGAIRAGGRISMIGGLSGAATELVAANAIKPVIDKVFGFDEAPAAYQHMASGAHFGKIVIRVS
jgi:NADPH:quinone reductase-like Zn-dependent oxidoreductase